MKLKAFVGDIFNRYFPSAESLSLRKELKKYPRIATITGELVLCQVVEDFSYLHKIIHFIIGYRRVKSVDISIGWILLRRNFKTASIKKKITVAILNNLVTDYIWYSLYKVLGGRVAFRYSISTVQQTGAAEWAEQNFNSLQIKDQIVELNIDDILVGDLIYDTYLRYKPAPTVDIHDVFLKELMEWAYDLTKQCQKFFNDNRVSAVITSYTSYIQHGVLARVAMSRQVPVYSMGAFNQLVQKPTSEFPFHKRNFHLYKDFFGQYHSAEDGRTIGREIIRKRLAGVVDSATFYMAKSSFHGEGSQKVFVETGRPRALVMGHDFYDSPHIYGAMVFPDFYEWICFVFNEAKDSPFDFYYKPHPNGLPENEQINEILRTKYPYIKFLDKRTSNRQILNEGVDIAFSVYGTVAHEFAYAGIPVVNAAVNPHQAYSFNIHAKSKKELSSYIHNIHKFELNKSELEEFCFVHNYRFIDNSMIDFPFNIDMSNWRKYFSIEGLCSRVDLMVENIRRCENL